MLRPLAAEGAAPEVTVGLTFAAAVATVADWRAATGVSPEVEGEGRPADVCERGAAVRVLLEPRRAGVSGECNGAPSSISTSSETAAAAAAAAVAGDFAAASGACTYSSMATRVDPSGDAMSSSASMQSRSRTSAA